MASCAVFASGNGSNLQALVDRLSATSHAIRCLVCDNRQAYAIHRAEASGIPVVPVSYRDRSREEAEASIRAALAASEPDILVLAGFMRLLSPAFVDAFAMRIVNIHPALLPRHPGTHGIEDSWAAGDSELGVTIHYVDHGMDTGPIILQKSFTREAHDTLESVTRKIHELEHEHYPKVVQALLDDVDRKRGERA
ncbi:MAG: phosphoribosylglycinamide formyltransferase [Candidatus Competibacteraceae bacterium]|nr:phosphoribosylglycinamide formyltransferase [Candidatus Competibacteraceae bacterium]